MEFNEIQTFDFLDYLKNIGVLNESESQKINDTFKKENKKLIFILADFFKKLTPSQAYDLSVRLYENSNNNKKIKKTENVDLVSPKIQIMKKNSLNIPFRGKLFNILNVIIKRRKLLSFKDLISKLKITIKKTYEPEILLISPEICTDRINNPPLNLVSLNRSKSKSAVHNRLFEESKEKKKNWKELEKVKIKLETQGCTFIPNASKQKENKLIHNFKKI